MNENPIKPIAEPKHGDKPLPKPRSVRTIKFGCGQFMQQGDSSDGEGAFSHGQRTIPAGHRRKVGRFMSDE